MSLAEYHHAGEAKLKSFVSAVLERAGVTAVDAATVAEVLVAADLRGIESHGTARLESFYLSRMRAGVLDPRGAITVVRETPVSVVFDAGNGLGHPAGKRAMQHVIDKANATGIAFGAVKNSNHYGIAGYYAMMALEHDMIGISSTNSVRYGAPTFGRDLMLGTNPWAYAIPAATEPPFVLDFATTTVARGRLEVFDRKNLPLGPGWALDADGNETLSARDALRGALLPLGGFGTDGGGHKGYGLGMLADIMCGVLSGGVFGTELPLPGDPPAAGRVSHFFGAMRIDAFRDAAAFKADMDAELRAFKASRTAPGCDRIYVAGEIEFERAARHRATGVPIHRAVWLTLERLAREYEVPFDLALESGAQAVAVVSAEEEADE